MLASKLWQLIILIVVLLCRSNYAKQSEKNVLQILIMEYENNPYKWENQMLEYTATILNEQLVEAMNEHYIPSIHDIYNEAISKMYLRIPAKVLVEQLWKMYTKNDWKSFLTMTRSQLSLFEHYKANKNRDFKYILMVANCFYKIKHDPLYVKLNDHTKDHLESAITSLPRSLQYLFGKQEFCLLNKMYSEMLYQSGDQVITGTSYIYTWSLVKNFSDNLGAVMPIFVETPEDNLSDLYLALASKHLNSYYYRLPEYGQIIGANLTQQVLKNYVWSVELINDDQLLFKQDDNYLMCGTASSNYEHGNVYAFENKNIQDTDCQWSAGECDRR